MTKTTLNERVFGNGWLDKLKNGKFWSFKCLNLWEPWDGIANCLLSHKIPLFLRDGFPSLNYQVSRGSKLWWSATGQKEWQRFNERKRGLVRRRWVGGPSAPRCGLVPNWSSYSKENWQILKIWILAQPHSVVWLPVTIVTSYLFSSNICLWNHTICMIQTTYFLKAYDCYYPLTPQEPIRPTWPPNPNPKNTKTNLHQPESINIHKHQSISI